MPSRSRARPKRLASWQEQLAALQRRQRVYDLTLQSIDRAERATMKTATRYLEAHMVRDLATATDGRYRRVRVDDRTLDIEVHAPEKADWVSISSLSQGTIDLVYLVARLGLVRLITGDRRPPLVFDDPFVTFDNARAARAVELLKTVAADFQVIYLHHVRSLRCGRRRGGGAARADRRRQLARGVAGLTDLLPAGAATVVFGLAAAITWGTGDFGGGLLTRRAPLFGVVLASQLVGTAVALILAVVRGETAPSPADLGWSVCGGLCGGIGISALYQGLAVGRMGIVAPITGVIGGPHPGRGRDRPRRAAGAACCSGSVSPSSRSSSSHVSATSAPDRRGSASRSWRASRLGLLGVAIAQISDGHVFGPLTVLRATEDLLIGAIVIVGRQAWRPPSGLWPALAGVGVMDMAGNGAFILAVQAGSLAVAAVLSSLYPVTTVVLATIVLHERVTRSHAVGIALAMAAIACIAAGSS